MMPICRLIIFSTLLINISSAATPQIKVKIGKALDSILVAGLDIQKSLHTKNITKNYQGRKSVKFNCVSKGTNLNKNEEQVLLASMSSPAGVIKWDNTTYRGELKVISSLDNKGCDLVNETPMEEYISTLLSKEMNASWPIEALKAQAVAARTYAHYQIKINKNNLYHLESSEKYQVSGAMLDETPRTTQAADQTSGQILIAKKNKEVTPIFYHAKCGGRTLTPEKVWANTVSGYEEVDCPFCHKYGLKPWSNKVEKSKFRQTLNKLLGFKNIQAATPKNSESEYMMKPDIVNERYVSIYRNGDLSRVKKADLRKVFGRDTIPSNNYAIQVDHKSVNFVGNGYGHGVGLCQLGALELAKRGYTYLQILSHYFPGHEIKKVY